MSNKQTIVTTLRERGWTDVQIAGMLGNLQVESNFNPLVPNNSEGAIGIAQWTNVGNRRNNIFAWAESQGLDPYDVRTQALMIDHEMRTTESGTWARLQGVNDPAEAARIIDQYYERSNGATRETRAGLAEQHLERIDDPSFNQGVTRGPRSGPSGGGGSGGGRGGGSPDTARSGGSGVSAEPSKASWRGETTNPLNSYMLVQYHLEFGMLKEDGNPKGQKIALAATAGVGVKEDHQGYYNIEKFHMDTVMGPTAGNRLINEMTTGLMTIFEPYGFSMMEDIRKMATKLGYKQSKEFHVGRMRYYVKIHFSGFSADGKWTPKIKFAQNKLDEFIYPVSIVEMDNNFDHKGSLYDIKFAPATHHGYRPEEITIMASTLNDIKGGGAATVGQFLEALAKNLDKSVTERTVGVIKRTFKFVYPDTLGNSPLRSTDFFAEKFFDKPNESGQQAMSLEPKTNVMVVLQAMLSHAKVAQDNLLMKDDPQFTKPRVHYTIRFFYDDGGFDGNVRDVNSNTVTFVFDEHQTWRRPATTTQSFSQEISQASQLRRYQKMLNEGYWVRTYNYVFTAENTEVINFETKFNTFYQTALNPFLQNNGGSSMMGGNTTASASTDTTRQLAQTNVATGLGSIASAITSFLGLGGPAGAGTASPGATGGSSTTPTGTPSAQSVLARAIAGSGGGLAGVSGAAGLAGGLASGSIAPNSDGDASRYNASIGERFPLDNKNGQIGSLDKDYGAYLVQIQNYLQNELIQIDLNVRGDPVWLLSAYGVQDLDLTGGSVKRNPIARKSRHFFLRFRFPLKSQYMNPTANFSDQKQPFFGAFYETIIVRNQFEKGKFTQTLQGVKLGHMNYIAYQIGSRGNTAGDQFLQRELQGLPPTTSPTPSTATPGSSGTTPPAPTTPGPAGTSPPPGTSPGTVLTPPTSPNDNITGGSF